VCLVGEGERAGHQKRRVFFFLKNSKREEFAGSFSMIYGLGRKGVSQRQQHLKLPTQTHLECHCTLEFFIILLFYLVTIFEKKIRRKFGERKYYHVIYILKLFYKNIYFISPSLFF